MKTKTKSMMASLLAAILLSANPGWATSVTLNFGAPGAGGNLLDSNGVATPFTTFLPGTGTSVPSPDPDMFFDTSAKSLTVYAELDDFNNSVNVNNMSTPGISLASLGFTGTNDFEVSAVFKGPVDSTGLFLDQIGIYVGTDYANLTKLGSINFGSPIQFTGDDTNGTALPTINGELGPGGTGINAADVYGFWNNNIGSGAMKVLIRRFQGNWSFFINGNLWNTPFRPTGTTIPGLDSATNLIAGIYVTCPASHAFPFCVLTNFTIQVDGLTPQTAPVIATQPQKQLINEGSPATLSVAVTPTTMVPYTLQWYKDNVLLPGQTGLTMFIPEFATTNVGVYTVAITNALGGIISSNAPLYALLPSGEKVLSFTSAGGSILDTNGVASGFTTRLDGTGTNILGNDPNLQLVTASNALYYTTTPNSDFGAAGAANLPNTSVPGVQLSELGFTGSQDFNAQVAWGPVVGHEFIDQGGLLIGTSATNHTRAGFIDFNDTEYFSVNNRYNPANTSTNGGGDVDGRFVGFGLVITNNMTITISRTTGNWAYVINGVDWTMGQQPNGGGDSPNLNIATNLTAGIFAITPLNADLKTWPVNSFRARVFGAPHLGIAKNGSNVNLSWNVIGPGLQSNTNLLNPNGWTAVPSTTSTNSLQIAFPTTGNTFYRMAP